MNGDACAMKFGGGLKSAKVELCTSMASLSGPTRNLITGALAKLGGCQHGNTDSNFSVVCKSAKGMSYISQTSCVDKRRRSEGNVEYGSSSFMDNRPRSEDSEEGGCDEELMSRTGGYVRNESMARGDF